MVKWNPYNYHCGWGETQFSISSLHNSMVYEKKEGLFDLSFYPIDINVCFKENPMTSQNTHSLRRLSKFVPITG